MAITAANMINKNVITTMAAINPVTNPVMLKLAAGLHFGGSFAVVDA